MSNDQSSPKIRVLMLPTGFLPDLFGGIAVSSDLAIGLAERGFDVTVRTPYPYYPEWKDKLGQNGWKIRKFVERGVKVERYGMRIPRNPKSLVARLLMDVSYILSLSRSLFSRQKFDLIIAYCPQTGGVAFAGMYRLLWRTPVMLNVQDMPADAAALGGMSKGRSVKSLLAWCQSVLFNRCDVWSSISPGMIDRLLAVRSRNQPIVLFPNWLHESLRKEFDQLPSKTRRPIGDRIKLLYAGNMGLKQGLMTFCQTLAKSDTPFEFRIHGGGAEAANVRDWVNASGDTRFKFGDILAEPEFVRALHDTDLFVITEKSGAGGSFFPSKMAPGMTSGSGIFAICDKDTSLGEEVRHYNLGPWLPWDRTEEAGELLQNVLDQPEQLYTWQQNSVDRSQFYDRNPSVDNIARVITEYIRDKKLPPSFVRPEVVQPELQPA